MCKQAPCFLNVDMWRLAGDVFILLKVNVGRGFGALKIQHLCGQVKSATRYLVSNGEEAGIEPGASSIISAQLITSAEATLCGVFSLKMSIIYLSIYLFSLKLLKSEWP